MKKFRPQREDHQRILALLKLIASAKGVRVRDLARQNGLSPSAIYNALYSPWPKGERILAGILGVEPQELWPSRYDSAGCRRSIPKNEFGVNEKILDKSGFENEQGTGDEE